jgi:hypothetical protein
MRPGPKNPGESAADYKARVKAMEDKFMNRPQGPKTGTGMGGSTKPRGGVAIDPARPRPGTGTMPTPKPVRLGGLGGGAPSTPRGTTPPPPKPPKPRPGGGRTGNDVVVRPSTPRGTTPTPPKPRPGGGRGTAAAPGYGGGKPRRMMSGGMVKGKKK